MVQIISFIESMNIKTIVLAMMLYAFCFFQIAVAGHKKLSQEESEFINAACSNDLELVKKFIKGGIDVNIQDNHGNTALMWAAENNNLEMVKHLIERGAKVNAQDNDGYTALMWLAYKNNLFAVEYLIECEVDVNTKGKYGKTALIWAAYNNNLEMVKHLIERGAQVDEDVLKEISKNRDFSNLSNQLTSYFKASTQKEPQALKQVIIKKNTVLSPYAWFALAINSNLDKNSFWHGLYALYGTSIKVEQLIRNFMYVEIPEHIAYHLIHCLTDEQKNKLVEKLKNGTAKQKTLCEKFIEYETRNKLVNYKSDYDLRLILN